MEEYKVNHGGAYPMTADEACDFLEKYAAQTGSASACTGSFGGSSHESVVTNDFTVSYFNNDLPHDYIGEIDEVDIGLSHWCNTDPVKFNEDPSHPITNGNEWPFDALFSRFVIWTSI